MLLKPGLAKLIETGSREDQPYVRWNQRVIVEKMPAWMAFAAQLYADGAAFREVYDEIYKEIQQKKKWPWIQVECRESAAWKNAFG